MEYSCYYPVESTYGRVISCLNLLMSTKALRASRFMLLNTILMGVVVVVGDYTPRFRRHPVIGGLFLVATTLFLPIVSIIVTIVSSAHDLVHYLGNDVTCTDEGGLFFLIVIWTGAVVVIAINASTVVVAGDAREGRSTGPPTKLLIAAIWTAYLTLSTVAGIDDEVHVKAIGQLFAIMFVKLISMYAAFYKARRSFAFGRNPRLIAGYMAQLQLQSELPLPAVVHDEHTTAPPPALIVMGEDNNKAQIEQTPHGYNLVRQGRGRETSRLVTLDRVLGMGDDDVMLQNSTVRPKDLCFSLALFKKLRCRFAKYTVKEAGFIKTSRFVREALLLHGDHFGRVFRIIRDELSFINDYYFSSLPIYYSHPLLAALGVMIPLWSIGYCLYLVVLIAQGLYGNAFEGQISCQRKDGADKGMPLVLLHVGTLYSFAVPLYIVLAVLVLAETRQIVAFICSNWTKVALIYHHVNQDCWQRPRVVQKCIWALMFKCRICKLVNNSWDDTMKQCSILELRRRQTPVVLRHRYLLRLLDRHKEVKVPNAVNAAIFEALKGESSFTTTDEQDQEFIWFIRPPLSPIPAVSVYACNNGRHPAAYAILVWHIATTMFEVSQKPPQTTPEHSRTVATHLSRYCTYLVSSRPELLPDDAEWCRGLYGKVKKDADRALAKVLQGGGEVEYDQLVQVLGADSNHEALRDGARIGKELVEDASMRWEALARFWVEMILYIAPSENLEAHVEAISHGGELITLIWAMLSHSGIVGRLDADHFCGE